MPPRNLGQSYISIEPSFTVVGKYFTLVEKFHIGHNISHYSQTSIIWTSIISTIWLSGFFSGPIYVSLVLHLYLINIHFLIIRTLDYPNYLPRSRWIQIIKYDCSQKKIVTKVIFQQHVELYRLEYQWSLVYKSS